MRSDIHLILDKAYQLFNVAPPAIPLDVCTHCCITVEQEQALRSMSVKEIPFDLLTEYNDAAKTAHPPIHDIRYLAPRFLELVSLFQFPSHSVELGLKRFNYHSADDWTEDELRLLKEFQVSFFSYCIQQYPLPDLERIDAILVMLWKMNLGIEHVLDEWLQHTELNAVLHLSDLIVHCIDFGRVTRLNNAFADEPFSAILIQSLSSDPYWGHFSVLLEHYLLQDTDTVLDDEKLTNLSWTYDMLLQLR